MNSEELLALINDGENAELECKLADGGLPKSLWSSYSAMANTNGGIILLGVKENLTTGDLTFQNIDSKKLQKDFWDNINNPQKVSSNILENWNVTEHKVNGNNIIQIMIPRAPREYKPVYTGVNPFQGTYRRDFEGDYKCSESEVRRMLADQTSEAQDFYILSNYSTQDLHTSSLQNYRKRFSVSKPDSDWNELDDIDFLIRIGGWRKDRIHKREGLTIAGLLMFGEEEAITSQFPNYFLDYRERLSDTPGERWSNRITSQDGNWSGNLFDFYFKVIHNITSDIAVPFAIEGTDFARQSDTRTHKALREAVLNALIHANYSGDVGIVIEKEKGLFRFSNPGVLRMPVSKAIAGGNSDPRNPNIFKAFFQLGLGERSGYGLESIHTTWKQQHWIKPSLSEEVRPERTTLTLSTTSLLPQFIVSFLEHKLKDDFEKLTADEVLILATAVQEGFISNMRIQDLTDMRSQDILKFITKLMNAELLIPYGYGKGKKYKPSNIFNGLDAFLKTYASGKDRRNNNEDNSSNNEEHGGNNEDNDSNNEEHGGNNEDNDSNNEDTDIKIEKLYKLAEKAKAHQRLAGSEMKQIILAICDGHYLSSREIAAILNRNPGSIARYLRELAQDNKLKLKYPENLNSRHQAYKTKK